MTRLLFLAALLALAVPARAQSAGDLYHEAARLYIGGERAAAEAAATHGLRLAPGDPKLQALLDRIRQQEQQQNRGGPQSQQQSDPDQQDGQQRQQGSEGEQQQDERQGQQDQQGAPDQPEEEREGTPSDHPEEQQPPPEQEARPRPGREGEQPRPEARRPGEGEATPESAVPVAPGAMTQEEAERILNAVGTEERLLLRRVQRRPGAERRVEKDW
jgi:hypothetical protein